MLGMRRLSIIDLAGGHQPVHNEDEHRAVRLQRRDLQLPRAARRARGARPPLLHALRHRGHRPRLRGVGRGLLRAPRRHVRASRCGTRARARWCSRAIASARSRCSTADDGDRLVFASELKSLLQVPGLPRARSIPTRCAPTSRFGYVPTPGSIFRGVRKLPPGHYLRFVDGSAQRASLLHARARAEAPRSSEARRRGRAGAPARRRRSRAGSSPTCRSARS